MWHLRSRYVDIPDESPVHDVLAPTTFVRFVDVFHVTLARQLEVVSTSGRWRHITKEHYWIHATLKVVAYTTIKPNVQLAFAQTRNQGLCTENVVTAA